MSDIEKIGGIAEAFRHADESVGDFLTKFPLEKVREWQPHHFVMDIHPEIVAIGNSPETQGYKLTEGMAGLLVGGAHRNPIIHQMAIEVCAANIFNGYPLPSPLRAFSALILRGKGPTPPLKRGPKPGRGLVMKMLVRFLALDLVGLYEIDLTRNNGSPPISACDAVIAAAANHGQHFSFSTVYGWFSNDDHADFRAQADEIRGLIKDSVLIQWGVLRPRI